MKNDKFLVLFFFVVFETAWCCQGPFALPYTGEKEGWMQRSTKQKGFFSLVGQLAELVCIE